MSASRPGRSVQTRLSTVWLPSAASSNSDPRRDAEMPQVARLRAPGGADAFQRPGQRFAEPALDEVGGRRLAARRRAAPGNCRRSSCPGHRARAPAGSPRPSRSSVMTIAANRPSRSGECTNTSSAWSPASSERTATTPSPGLRCAQRQRLPGDLVGPRAQEAVFAGNAGTACWPRRRRRAAPTAGCAPRRAFRRRARSAATGCSSPLPQAPAASTVRRSASRRSFQAFHSFGEVPAMSAQVSR